MSRRGIPTAILAIGAVVILIVVALVAYAAGTANGAGVEIGFGRMRGVMDRGMWGIGWMGWGLGWLVFIALIGGVVWAIVALTRADEPRAPLQPPPVAGPPVAGPPAGSAAAFEAWHRQAHAAERAAAATSDEASPEAGTDRPAG